MRIEKIALHIKPPEFFVGCAQIAVTNGGNGKPGPLVAIPGVYNGNVRKYFFLLFADRHFSTRGLIKISKDGLEQSKQIFESI